MKTLLLSALTRQLLIDRERAAQAYPNDWLIWEAGVLNAPRGNVGAAVTVSEALDLAAALPRIGDPLCFLLDRKQPGAAVTIGRAEGNDIVLADHTVSRHHCTLTYEELGWTISAAEETLLDGQPVPSGAAVEVTSGQIITLGNLSLKLYTAQGMLARITAKLERR